MATRNATWKGSVKRCAPSRRWSIACPGRVMALRSPCGPAAAVGGATDFTGHGKKRRLPAGRAGRQARGHGIVTPKSRFAVAKSWKPSRAPAARVTVPFATTPPDALE